MILFSAEHPERTQNGSWRQDGMTKNHYRPQQNSTKRKGDLCCWSSQGSIMFLWRLLLRSLEDSFLSRNSPLYCYYVIQSHWNLLLRWFCSYRQTLKFGIYTCWKTNLNGLESVSWQVSETQSLGIVAQDILPNWPLCCPNLKPISTAFNPFSGRLMRHSKTVFITSCPRLKHLKKKEELTHFFGRLRFFFSFFFVNFNISSHDLKDLKKELLR